MSHISASVFSIVLLTSSGMAAPKISSCGHGWILRSGLSLTKSIAAKIGFFSSAGRSGNAKKAERKGISYPQKSERRIEELRAAQSSSDQCLQVRGRQFRF